MCNLRRTCRQRGTSDGAAVSRLETRRQSDAARSTRPTAIIQLTGWSCASCLAPGARSHSAVALGTLAEPGVDMI
ncbi:hypothetical protein CC85DRAFT_164750 [Cutaneotrichosporon oleaginosum]|uniref:Uncharacterized protein n=1 Tax=Cutaneotrichosporon oleaginosum TaxID=879819 RepID=A0A0J1AXG7_9TREE|nr:uncharacterized protein CC85DRAFT_164750 [Cutaneotrichosporon oleaginosum]KLT40009.1 hypothetical protein CC85DRAFT_164750 [Cutaneotrichosporon oleaginosum]TXT13848.1 hypothetical protein COLE_00041 [Cutaneotrichosporon oleaginosum]